MFFYVIFSLSIYNVQCLFRNRERKKFYFFLTVIHFIHKTGFTLRKISLIIFQIYIRKQFYQLRHLVTIPSTYPFPMVNVSKQKDIGLHDQTARVLRVFAVAPRSVPTEKQGQNGRGWPSGKTKGASCLANLLGAHAA